MKNKMNKLSCDLCSKDHTVENCILIREQSKVPTFKYQQSLLPNLSHQTLPNWVYIEENQKKVFACKDIEVSFKIGPFLAPQTAALRENINFPLCIQISENVKLWLDQSDESKCNWLALIPAAPQTYNMVACQICDSIYFIVTKPIKVGQELSVWYASHYMQRISSEVLERTMKNIQEKNKILELTDVINSKSTQDMSIKNGCDSGTLFHNSVPLGEAHFLDTLHGPYTNIVSGKDFPYYPTINVGNGHNSKVLLTCSVSLSSSLMTGLSTAPLFTVVPQVSIAQSLSVAQTTLSSSGSVISAVNPEVYNSFPPIPIYVRPSEFLHVSSQTDAVDQNISEDTFRHSSKKNAITSGLENVGIQLLRDYKQLAVPSETEEKHSSCLEGGSSRNTALLSRPLCRSNLATLQSITINESKITFTHLLSKSKSNDGSSCTDQQELGKINSSHTPPNSGEPNASKRIIVKTSKGNGKRKASLPVSPVSENNIYFDPKNNNMDTNDGHDMISLTVTEDSSHPLTPVCTVIKRQQMFKNISKYEAFSSGSAYETHPSRHWKCLNCPESFTDTQQFALHLKDHLLINLGRKFACQVCNFKFKRLSHLRLHEKSHTKQQLGKTEKEGSLSENKSMKSWISNNTNTNVKNSESKEKKSFFGTFECQICQKRSSTEKYLLRHLSKHCGEFICSLCNKGFARNQNLKSHICIQTTEKSGFKCNICKKVFKNESTYKIHKIQHDESVSCEWCSRIFMDLASLEKHEKNCLKSPRRNEEPTAKTNSSVVGGGFTCHYCSRAFSSFFFLKNHVTLCKQMALVSEKGTVNCDRCDALCVGPTELRSHLQTHTHPYLCLSCSQRFRWKGTYETHICNVTFCCDCCDVSERTLHNLFKHITCHGPPPLCCVRCRYPFYKRESLNTHDCQMEVKEEMEKRNRKMMTCPFCPSLFVAEHNLKKHMASLHGVPVKQRFACGKCRKTFHRSDLLKSHEKTHLAPSLECQECHKKFKSQRSLANHSVLHLKDYRFTCKYCNKEDFDLLPKSTPEPDNSGNLEELDETFHIAPKRKRSEREKERNKIPKKAEILDLVVKSLSEEAQNSNIAFGTFIGKKLNEFPQETARHARRLINRIIEECEEGNLNKQSIILPQPLPQVQSTAAVPLSQHQDVASYFANLQTL